MNNNSTDISREEGNKLIAEFMGGEFVFGGFWMFPSTYRVVLSYHHNWGELMSVIDYIDSFHERCDGKVYCKTTETSHTFYINFNSGNVINEAFPKYNDGRHRTTGESRIDNVWQAIIPFILWYNSNNQNS